MLPLVAARAYSAPSAAGVMGLLATSSTQAFSNDGPEQPLPVFARHYRLSARTEIYEG